MPKNEPTREIDRFLGVNNSERPSRLAGGWLTDADNVDIDDTGALDLRPGYSSIGITGAVTAAYSTDDEEELYIVEGGDLKRVNEIVPLDTTTLATGLGSGEIHWTEVGNQIFYVGETTGIIHRDEVMSFGIPSPALPGLTATAGDLEPGRYLAALVYRDQYGREGGCTALSEIELHEPGGILFEFQVPVDLVAVLYVSEVNGDQVFRITETIAGSFQWSSGHPSTVLIDGAQVNAYPPPENIKHIAFHDSRVVVSETVGDVSYLHRSKPFWYFLFDMRDYIAVPGRVRMLLATKEALIIGTDDEVYAWSTDSGLHTLADYGVVPGQAAMIGGRAFFWTKRGLCTALPFENLTDDIYSVPPGARAAVGLNEANGRKMLVVATDLSGEANNPYTGGGR